MKFSALLLFAALVSCGAQSEKPVAAPAYVDEAPLPEGWPKPGPYDQVAEKSYPAYRAAFTTREGEARAFWQLFGHIKKNNIPMTAPVEMAMDSSDGAFEQSTMAFLYQNENVGKIGPDGETVEVRDVSAAKVLSYTWQGEDSKVNIAKAKESLEAALSGKKIIPKSFRLLGYNGPATPRAKKTWELQALLN
ncbi:MAG: heme-binding protein [Akkermansiaceae bacterium]